VRRADIEGITFNLPTLDEQKVIVTKLKSVDKARRIRQTSISLINNYLRSLFIEMFGDPIINTKGWPTMKFGEVCDTRLGKMLDAKQQTGKNKRPYLRNANVKWGRFDLSEVFEMDFDAEDRQEFRLLNGDILICEGGEVGRAAIWNDEMPECYFQKALHRARPKKELATSIYIRHLLEMLAFGAALAEHTSQATIAHLTGIKLKGMKIPLPPISLQNEFQIKCKQQELLTGALHKSDKELNQLFESFLAESFSEAR
jgi:type I restriction enzyme S subunit